MEKREKVKPFLQQVWNKKFSLQVQYSFCDKYIKHIGFNVRIK